MRGQNHRVQLSLALLVLFSCIVLHAQPNQSDPVETHVSFTEAAQPWKMPSAVFLGDLLCGDDGRILGQFVIGPHLETASVVALGPGLTPVTFDTSKVNDIRSPSLNSFDWIDGQVLMLLSGERKQDFAGPASSTQTTRKERGDYIYLLARFSDDGALKASTVLDLPFVPVRVAAISSERLLILGVNKANAEAVIGLADGSGTLLRYFDVPLPTQEQLTDQKADPTGINRGLPIFNRVEGNLSSYTMVHHANKLLLYHPRGSADILEVSASGAARSVTIQMPADLALLSILPSDGGDWIAHGVAGERVAPYLLDFDPDSGKLVRKLITVEAPASSILCVDHGQFFGYRSQQDKNFLLESQR